MSDASVQPFGPAALGVGTAMFIRHYGLSPAGWQRPDTALLRRAVEGGVRYLDTAASYGDAEAGIGELGDFLGARDVRVCTKIGIVAETTVDGIVRDVDASVARLRRQSIDTLLVHNGNRPVLQAPALAAAWSTIKARGLAARTGASTYGVDDACLALSMDTCDVVQVEYSILNQEVVRAAVTAKRPGQELVVRSVLCKGLLTARRAAAPVDARAVKKVIDEIEVLAGQWQFTLPELAIRFALDTPGVDVVLVGVGTAEELATALAAAGRAPLNVTQLQILRDFDRSALDSVHPERWGRVAVQ